MDGLHFQLSLVLLATGLPQGPSATRNVSVDIVSPVIVHKRTPGPSAPRNVSVEVESSTSVKLKWKTPEYENGDLKGYEIIYKIVGDVRTNKYSVTSQTFNYTAAGLRKFTKYSFAVRAETIIKGVASIPVEVTTFEDAPSLAIFLGAPLLIAVVSMAIFGWRRYLRRTRSLLRLSRQLDLPRVIDVAMDTDGSLSEHAPGIDVEVKYDAFICYSSRDSSFGQQLLQELEQRGFRCCVDVRDFEVGATIVENIADAIYSSRKTLAVLSPDFVRSEWCRHEIRQALARIRSHQVVPILLAECDIPPLLRDRTYLDWINCQDKDIFWNKLEETLTRG